MKKTMRRFAAALMALALCVMGGLSTFAVTDSGYVELSNMKWYYEDGVITFEGADFLPDQFAQASYLARYEQEIRKAILPETLTAIGDLSFNGCPALREIDIPKGVTRIGMAAFCGCRSLVDLTLPRGLKSLGSYAFSGAGLSHVSLPDGVTSLGWGVFSECENLTVVDLPAGLTSIPIRAFGDCPRLHVVNIPAGVTAIGDYAFEGCDALTAVVYEGTAAQWAKVEVGEGNEALLAALQFSDDLIASGNCGSYGGDNLKWELRAGVLTISGEGEMDTLVMPPWYDYRDLIHTVIVEEGVTSIEYGTGDGAFHDCIHLKKVSIPSTVKHIGYGTFWGCTSLTSITIPDNVGNISMSMFEGCTSLRSVTLGSGIVDIGRWAFDNCSSLTSIKIPAKVKSIDDGAFGGCNSLQSLTVDEKNTTYFSKNNCIFKRSDPATVAFGCVGSTIPADGSVTAIGAGAFAFQFGLRTVRIPDSVTSIGASAFYACKGLTGVKLPAGLAEVDVYAFDGCDALNRASYVGTQAEWAEKVTVAEGNDALLSALRYEDAAELPGDISGDGVVNAADRTYLARALAGWSGYPMPDASVADMNGDGNVNAADRTYLARALAGWSGYTL